MTKPTSAQKSQPITPKPPRIIISSASSSLTNINAAVTATTSSTCALLPKPKIMDLPDRAFLLIFWHLSVQENLLVRQVNRKFRQLSLASIDDLLLGKNGVDFGLLFRPAFKIDITIDSEKHQLMKLLLTECGRQSLKHLAIGHVDVRHETYREKWLQTLSSIPQLCFNIVGLQFAYTTVSGLEEIYLSLVRHYADQLEMVSLLNFHTDKDPYRFAMEYLNPKCLRRLSIDVDNQQKLNQVLVRFPLLTHLCVRTWEKDEPEPDPTSSTPSWDCLQQFALEADHRSKFPLWLKDSPLLSKLNKLSLSCDFEDDLSPILPVFASLTSLSIHVNASKHLAPLFQVTKSLKFLNLTACFYENESQLIENGNKELSKLTTLKNLRLDLNFRDDFVTFDFLHFEPMPSVTHFDFNVWENFKPALSSEEEDDAAALQAKPPIEQCLNFVLLPTIFPNLTHLSIKWETMFLEDLMNLIEKLLKLRSLRLIKESVARSDLKPLRVFCIKRKINFNFGF